MILEPNKICRRITSSFFGVEYECLIFLWLFLTSRNIPHVHLHEKRENKDRWHGAEIHVIIEGNWTTHRVSTLSDSFAHILFRELNVFFLLPYLLTHLLNKFGIDAYWFKHQVSSQLWRFSPLLEQVCVCTTVVYRSWNCSSMELEQYHTDQSMCCPVPLRAEISWVEWVIYLKMVQNISTMPCSGESNHGIN